MILIIDTLYVSCTFLVINGIDEEEISENDDDVLKCGKSVVSKVVSEENCIINKQFIQLFSSSTSCFCLETKEYSNLNQPTALTHLFINLIC